MKPYSLSHLSDHTLLRDLASLAAQDRVTTAAMLAHLAEVDARKLYLPAGYPSMYAWCVGELKLSEDAAAKRIQAARIARRFPAIFPMLADGRLHLSGVNLLAPYLTPENADDLLAATTHHGKAGIQRLIAERFPRPDLPALVQPLVACEHGEQHAPAHVILTVSGHSAEPESACDGALTLAPVEVAGAHPASGHVGSRSKLAPLSAGRFALQVTIAQGTHDKLRYAQTLLGHTVPSGDLAQVLERALDALIAQLEQRRFARTARTRPSRRPRGTNDGRYIPAAIRRMVWQRDGGQCTFVSDSGHRCEARTRLEFDHAQPFARDGQATPSGLRLLCRAHNQLAAERTYGVEFMRHQRDEARRRSEATREAKQAREARTAREAASKAAQARERAAAQQASVDEVIPWLRRLGFRADEARRAAPLGDELLGAPLEARLRAAISRLAPPGARRVPHITSASA